MTADKHSYRSSEREEYLEYAFLAQLCSYGWSKDRFVEVARAHSDAFGYDLILSCDGRTRHVQLKSSVVHGKASAQNIHKNLARKQEGCVVWMWIAPESLEINHFLWFEVDETNPALSLGNKSVKHTKGDSTGRKSIRNDHSALRKSAFQRVDCVSELFNLMFGAGEEK